MAAYNIETSTVVVAGQPATMLKVAFGDPADNGQIVCAAEQRMSELKDELAGPLALINGPASLPAAVVIAHALTHRFAAVAVFDPKMGSYVVASSHGTSYAVGQAIPATEVVAAAE